MSFLLDTCNITNLFRNDKFFCFVREDNHKSINLVLQWYKNIVYKAKGNGKTIRLRELKCQ